MGCDGTWAAMWWADLIVCDVSSFLSGFLGYHKLCKNRTVCTVIQRGSSENGPYNLFLVTRVTSSEIPIALRAPERKAMSSPGSPGTKQLLS